MIRLSRIVAVAAIVALMAVGCSSDRNSLYDGDASFLAEAMYTIPAGANITSATFNIYVTQFSSQPVNLYRVTSDWQEMTVTWNSFADAFDGTVVGSFNCDNLGWKSCDVTGIVQSWANGTYPNFGFLLDQPDVLFTVATYHSREAVENLPSFLEVCYEVNGVSHCLQMTVEKDAYLRQYYPDLNWGDIEYLATGWGSEEYLEKRSLVRFDFDSGPPEEQPGCTRTIGYWKNHAGCGGPQDDVLSQYLPIWLGTPGGANSIEVTDNLMACELLSTKYCGSSRNGIGKLYAQLLAARLNQAAGADTEDIDEVLSKADGLLAAYGCDDWSDLSKKKRNRILRAKTKLDSYNNGLIGPGHCDDGGDNDCDYEDKDCDDRGDDDGSCDNDDDDFEKHYKKGKFKCDKSHDHNKDRGNCGRHRGDD